MIIAADSGTNLDQCTRPGTEILPVWTAKFFHRMALLRPKKGGCPLIYNRQSYPKD